METGGSLIGRTIGGRFTITAFLAEGGMGAIYRGTCDDEPGGVAIKVLSDAVAESETFVRRFQREARTVARLRHRGTVRILDHGVDDGLPYIVMELVAGAELQRILEHETRLPEARAVRIMAQVCSALSAAHDLGVVHRDLKPENVMILREGDDAGAERVKVLDFGIAKILSPDQVAPDALPVSSDRLSPSSNVVELTKMGTMIGTPDYMAPEQFRGEEVDARTDVYACGVLLHRMLTGQVPLAAGDWVKTARLRMHYDAAPRPSALVATTAAALDDLVAATLACERAARPSSARQLQEQLLALLPELAESLRPVSALPAPSAAASSARTAESPASVALTIAAETRAVVGGVVRAPAKVPSWLSTTLTSPTLDGASAADRPSSVEVLDLGGARPAPLRAKVPAKLLRGVEPAPPDSAPQSQRAMFHYLDGGGGAMHLTKAEEPAAEKQITTADASEASAATASPFELAARSRARMRSLALLALAGVACAVLVLFLR